MGFGKCHLFFGCDIMKFFTISLFLLLLFDSPQGSSLPHRRSVRALNTTLQTNFNGTYERRNPCTNAEIETSSYIASHEFRHHTKEDTWSDYSHKCSAIISGFLQAIGNLVRFNNNQHGIFNFHINTSISQKQDGHCDPNKQESCGSLPTIIIEATDGEISPKSSVENRPLQAKPSCERNAKERKYPKIGQSSNEEGEIGELVTSTLLPPKVYPSQRQDNELSTTIASSQPSTSASRGQNIFYSKDYPTTPQCQTTSISFRDTTPVYPQQILQNGDNLSTPDDVLLTDEQASKNVPPFVSQFPGKGIATSDQTSSAVFDDIPLNTPTTCEPEQKHDFYGTSPTPIFKPDVPNAITFQPEDVSTTTDRFPTACEPSPPNTLENPSSETTITYPEKLEPLNSISSSPIPFGGFSDGTGFKIPSSTPREPSYSTQDFTHQTTTLKNTEEQFIENQFHQPSLLDGQQPVTVDPRQPLHDSLAGRAPESQQSATHITPANEVPTTGLSLNQADGFIPPREPTPLGRPFSYPQILPSSEETAVSPGPEFQGVPSFNNGNSPNEYSSQPPETLLNTPVPIPSEFPQTVIPAHMNSFSLPPQFPNLGEIENINTTPLPHAQNLPDPLENNNSPESNAQILTDPNSQNQGITSIRPEYDELSNQMSTTKPPQSNDDFLINTTPTIQYYGPTSTPRFPINYPVSPASPTIFPTDSDTNENTTPIPGEFTTNSPQQDQKTSRTADASLASELGFTDAQSPFTIETQSTEPAIFYDNRPTTLSPNQQSPTGETYSNQNYNEFSLTTTTQRQSFFTPESQLNQTPFNTEQNLAENNEQLLNTPVENAQVPIYPTPVSPTIPDFIIPTDFPNRGPALNNNNIPVSTTFQPITPKFQTFQSTASTEQQPEKYEVPQPSALLEPVISNPFQPPTGTELQSVDYPSGGSTQMPEPNVFNQQLSNTFNQPEPQLISNAPYGEIPTNMPPQPKYTAASAYGDETMTTAGPQSQFSPDYTGIPDSPPYSQQTPNSFIQPESQLKISAPFNQSPSTASPEQQPIGKFDIQKFPASVQPGVSSPFQPPTGLELQSVDYPNVGTTQIPDPNVFNQESPNTFNQPEPQLTSNESFGDIPTTLPPETQYSADPAYAGETMTMAGPQSQSSPDYTGISDSTQYSQQTPNSFIQPESQPNTSAPFNQFPSTEYPEQQPIGQFDIQKFPASVQPGVSIPFQPPAGSELQSPDYPSDGSTQVTNAFISNQNSRNIFDQPMIDPGVSTSFQLPTEPELQMPDPNVLNQPESQLTSNAAFEVMPTTLFPETQYSAGPEYGSEIMTTAGPQSQSSPDYTGIPDSPPYSQQTPNSFIQPESQLKISAPFNQSPSTASPEHQPIGKFDIPKFPASVQPGVPTPFQPLIGSELPSVDYPNVGTTQMPDPNVFNQESPNTFNQPEPQLTSNESFGDIPTTLPPETQYSADPAYAGETMTMAGPQSQSSPDYTGISDSTQYSQQTPNSFIQPESQLKINAPFNQSPSTASPEQQPIGQFDVPKFPASVQPGVPTPFQPATGPEFQSKDYSSDGNNQMPNPNVFTQQLPNTFNQEELTSNASFEEIPTTLSPETQYSGDPAYGGPTMTTVEPQSQSSFGLLNSTANNQEFSYVGFQPEPQFSTQFSTTLFPELQSMGDYEIPPPPTSAPAYEEGIMTTQLPTTPEFQPPSDYANQYDSDGKTGIPPSAVINQKTPSLFPNPELQFPGNLSPNQFSSPAIQSDDTMPFAKASSPTEYLTSPVPESAPEGFMPTLPSTDSQSVTDPPAAYSNQNLDYSTITPFINSIPATSYKNQPELRPDLIAQTSPDKFPTPLTPDYSDQTYTTIPPFMPSSAVGYQGENNFSGLSPSITTTSNPSQHPDESQTTLSSQPVTPQTPFSSNQNPNGTLAQPLLPISDDPRMLGQYSDIYSTTAPGQYQTKEPAQFLDGLIKMATEVPIQPVQKFPDRPFGSFTTSGINHDAETAYTGTPPNSFSPERSLNSDSLIYNQMEQRPSTIGPYTVDDFSRGNQTEFSLQPFSQDLNNKFPNEQSSLNPEFSNSDSAPQRYETAYPEQTFDPRDQLSYETFPTTRIPNQELTTDKNSVFINPLTTQMHEGSFASSNQLSNYGTTSPALDPALENSSATSPTPFMTLNEDQFQQGPNQLNEYSNGGFTSGPQPTPTIFRASQPQTMPPFNQQQPFYPPQAASEIPALLPEETSPSSISAVTFAPQSEPQPQDVPKEQFYNYGQTTQMLNNANTPPVQEPLIVYPMNYQPSSDTIEQLPYPGSGATDLPSGPQPNVYNKVITSNEYQSTTEGPRYPNEISNFNSLPESSITFPPVGSESRIPQFTNEEPSAVSVVTGQPTGSPKMQTDAHVSYSQTQSTSELESQSMVSTSGNNKSLPSKFQPQTGTTLPYSNDRSGGFNPAFDVSEQMPSNMPLQVTPSGLTENQTIQPNEFQNLDSTFTQPENNNPLYDNSNPSTESIPSAPTISPGLQYKPNQQQPELDSKSDVDYNQFPSTVSPQFTPTYNEESISATDYPSLLPKPTTLSQPSLDYYTDVSTFDRKSENEHSLNGIDPRQGTVPQPSGVLTGSPNFTYETSAPTGEYQGPVPGTSTAPVPQDTPNSQQNLKSEFVQENIPIYSTPDAPEPQPQQPFDYTTEIPGYQTTIKPVPNSNISPPFQPEAFASSGPSSADTLEPTYTNAQDQNTRPYFPFAGTQPESQNAGQEYDPNFNTPTPMNNPTDLAFGNRVPELIPDGFNSSPYQTINPTGASYQTFPTPSTQPTEAQTNLSIEPNISIGEPNETFPAQKTPELTGNIPSQFQPGPTQSNDEGATLAPEFKPTPPINFEQFSPSSSEIPNRNIQNQPVNKLQPNPFLETQQLGLVDPQTQYTTPRQHTDFPQPQDEIPNRFSFNRQQETPSTDQLLQQNLPSVPVFYGQVSSTAPPEHLNGAPATTSEYPAPEPQAPVLNYPPHISNPERQASQTDQTQFSVQENPMTIYNQAPSTLFPEQPTFERSGDIVSNTPPPHQAVEPQSVDLNKQPGQEIPGTGSDKAIPNDFNKSQTEIFSNAQETFNGYQPTPKQYDSPESKLNSNTARTQSDPPFNIPSSFQQTTPSEISTQTQTPQFETSDSNSRLTSGPLTPPQTIPPSFAPEQQTTKLRPFTPFSTDAPLNYGPDFPVSDAPTDKQFSHPDTLLNNDNNQLGVSPQGVTGPQPNDSTESSSYPDPPFTRYNVRKRPDRQLAFGGTTMPQNLENKNDNEGPLPVNMSQRPELDQQGTVLRNPVSPNFGDYDQGFPTQPSNLREYGGATLDFVPRDPTDRRFITEGPYDPRLGTIAQRETGSPLGFGFEERPQRFQPSNGLSTYPPQQQNQHPNPLLQTMESQMPFPMHGFPQRTGASSFPERVSLDPRSSPIPFSFKPQTQNDVSTIPTYYPGGGFERNFVTSQPSQSNTRVNTAQEVMNTPLPDSHALVSDLTPTPSNKPGEDYVSCCRNGSSPLLCPFDPVLKGNMTAPSYYILISKLPVVDDKNEHFQVEKVYLGDGTPLNCTLGAGKTFPTSQYTPIQIKAARAVTLPTKTDFA